MNSRPSDSAKKRHSRVVLLYWGRRGGGSHFTLFLARQLSGSAETAEVILSLSRHNEDMAAFRASGLPILEMNRPTPADLWRKVWTLPHVLRKHADDLASLKPDAVIITMNSPFVWPFIHALRRRGLRVIYVAHDAEPHPGDYASTWQRWTQDRLLRSADGIVTLSNSVATRLSERISGIEDRTAVIPLASVFQSHCAQRPPYAPDCGPIRLLFYGRLISYKGLDILAQALEPLRHQHSWQLTIAGSGPLEAQVKSTFSEWPQVNLELGWVSDQRTAELFASHHLLVCPYTEASQSGVIAQAMSWAMPSLVMPTGALPEQIGLGKAGVVAETADAEGFRSGLRQILEQPNLLNGLSRAAAAYLAEHQSSHYWTKLIEESSERDQRTSVFPEREP